MTDASPGGAPKTQDIQVDPNEAAALAALDLAIANHDPDFNDDLKNVGPDLQPENMDLFDVNSAVDFDEKTMQKFFGRFKATSQRRFKILLARLTLFFKQTLPDILKFLLDFFKKSLLTQKKALSSYGRLKAFQKFAIFFCLILIFGSGFLVNRFATQGLFSPKIQIFTTNLEELAEKSTFLVEPGSYESFYDSSRVSQNVMNLKKMNVNLRASINSGDQPMVAIEFFVEGYAPEVVIEVKDREAEIQDLFQRAIEEVSYDELEASGGKRRLQTQLRDRLNQILTQGNVKRVFFKNIILKP